MADSRNSSSWKCTLSSNNEPLCFTGHQLFDAPETGASRATSHCLAIISRARSFKRMISMQMSGSKRTGGPTLVPLITFSLVYLQKRRRIPRPVCERNHASRRKRRSFFCLRAICTRDSSLNRIRPELTACATPSRNFDVRWNAQKQQRFELIFFFSPPLLTIKSGQVGFGDNIIFVFFFFLNGIGYARE